MKKILSSIFLVMLVLLSSATLVSAQSTGVKLDYSGFVKCDGVVSRDEKGAIKKGEEARDVECNFAALMNTIAKGINFLFYISIPVAATLFAYAGALYMTGTSGNIGTAKKIFTSVGIGFIIMVTGWFGVRTFVDWFVKDTSGANTFLAK